MISPQRGNLYQQLADQLRAAIITGRIRPGQPLPSERTLMQEHGIARETVRKAIAQLRNEGLVVTQRGHGVLVREQPDLDEFTPPSGAAVSVRMPTVDERAQYDIAEGTPVFHVVDPVTGRTGVYPGDRWKLRWPAGAS